MAKNLEKIDKQYLWHPFTQMKEWAEHDQPIIDRGDGVYLYDINGNKYLDGVSSLWVTVHGHRKKELNRAIIKQLNKVAHSTLLGLGNVPSIELAEKLVAITPKGLEKVFYSDDGSTAVEIALKIAFQYQQLRGQKQKQKFITLQNAYHGDTVGSVSVGGIDLFHKIYRPLLFKSYQAPVNLAAIEKIMKKRHGEIAALIMEPLVQAAAGMLLQPKGFLSGVRKLCAKYDILLIVDEVATGFGRTGKMFACEKENVSPDIMCVAKGLTGGYLPVAATLTTKKIFNAFLNKTFFHGHTYTGNPLGCAAAVANLLLFKQERTIARLQPKIKLLQDLLRSFSRLGAIKEVRQCGFMVGIELFPLKKRFGHLVIVEARKRGAILRPLGDVIVLMPPLSITPAELKELLKITSDSITAAADL